MKRIRSFLRRPHWVAACLATSCSVLTVDVDVYKGPLADHHDLQMQQLVVLAVGAKPILIELRDMLEGEVHGVERLSTYLPNEGFIEPGTYDLGDGEFVYLFEDRLAAGVNAILSLYDDRLPADIAGYLSRLRRLAGEHRRAYVRLRPEAEGRAIRAEDWRRFAVAMETRAGNEQESTGNALATAVLLFPANVLNWFAEKPRTYDPGCDADLKALKAAYRDFLVGRPRGSHDWRDETAIFEAHDECGSCVPTEWQDCFAVNRFNHLRDSELVRGDAMRLFGHGSTGLMQEFIDEVTSISAAFEHAGRLGYEIATEARRVRDAAAESDDLGPQTKLKIVSASRAILDQLVVSPAEDERLSELTTQSFIAERSDDRSEREAMVLPDVGRVRDLEELADYDQLTRTLTFLTGASGGFSSGRDDTGLDTRIEEYLDEKKSGRDSKRTDLLAALVRFSTKMLRLADDEAVLRGDLDDETSRRYIRVLQAIGNSIRVQADELVRYYEDRDGTAARNELLAMRAAFEPTPEELLSRTRAGLEAEQAARVGAQRTRDKAQAALDAQVAKVDLAKAASDAAGLTLQPLAESRTGWNAALSELSGKAPDALGALDPATPPDLRPALAASVTADPVAGSAAMTAVLAAIQAEENAPGTSATAKARKASARAHLTAEAAKFTAIASAPKDTTLAALMATIVTEAKAAGAAADLPEKDAEAKREAHQQAVAKRDKLQDSLAQKESRLAELTARAGAIDHAVATLSDAGAAAVQRLYESSATPSAQDARVAILKLFPENAASDDGKKARAIARGLLGQSNASLLAEVQEGDTAADVLDRRIAALRHELVSSIEASGPNGRTEYLIQALDVARSQRADLAFPLRPAAVLRSSLPFADSQGGVSAVWDNLLFEHGIESVPFLGGSLTSQSQTQLDREVFEQIDKRSWQNINRVRVAGAGNTNYVIAKDDVGNWYVKGYAADSGPIMESMTKLGLATLAPTGAASVLDANGDVREEVQVTSGLGDVFAGHESRYTKETQAHADSVLAALGGDDEGLLAKAKAAWKPADAELPEGLEKILDDSWSAAGLAEDRTALEGASDEAKAGEILDALSALTRFAAILDQKLSEQKVADDLAKAADADGDGQADGLDATVLRDAPPSQFADQVHAIVGAFVTETIAERRDANEDLSTAVEILSPTDG